MHQLLEEKVFATNCGCPPFTPLSVEALGGGGGGIGGLCEDPLFVCCGLSMTWPTPFIYPTTSVRLRGDTYSRIFIRQGKDGWVGCASTSDMDEEKVKNTRHPKKKKSDMRSTLFPLSFSPPSPLTRPPIACPLYLPLPAPSLGSCPRRRKKKKKQRAATLATSEPYESLHAWMERVNTFECAG